MKIISISLYPYDILLTSQTTHKVFLLHLITEMGLESWGEIAPLPFWSRETLDEILVQLKQKKSDLLKIDWTKQTYLKELIQLKLFPALNFGLESALLALLDPLEAYSIETSALLMGTVQEILEQAELRQAEGYTSAKIKISQLSFKEADSLLHKLKTVFNLRVDVNRAWKTLEALEFFSQFSEDAFDYIEEPFQNPKNLALFTHPLAVDESFPKELSLTELLLLPKLKALIYKPTMQGGLNQCLPLYEWSRKAKIELILSSSFESDVGLSQIANLAKRLSLSSPIGIGTYFYLTEYVCPSTLQFIRARAYVNTPVALKLIPKINLL